MGIQLPGLSEPGRRATGFATARIEHREETEHGHFARVLADVLADRESGLGRL
jgi:hypothetical protein